MFHLVITYRQPGLAHIVYEDLYIAIRLDKVTNNNAIAAEIYANHFIFLIIFSN